MERVDRISDLPEHLLHHVLSFLSFQQVAQTCIVSKTWEKAWHTFPILAFDYDFFERDICNFPILEYDSSLFEPDMQYLALFIHPYMNSDNRLKGERRRRMLFYAYLLNYMEGSLRNRYNEMVTIEKLTIEFINLTEIFSSVIDRCLGYALGCNVKELCFKLGYIHIPDYGKKRIYLLPQMVLCAESLHVLNISGAKLESPKNVKLSFLRKLSLHCVLAAEGVIETIIAGCPLLEDLSVGYSRGFKSLKLFGLPKLNKVEVEEMSNLERLEMKAFNVQVFSIAWSDIPRHLDITLCKNLICLKFRRTSSIMDEWLCDHISKFPLLKCLYFDHCSRLRSIKISSFSLKRLHICLCERLVEVKLETPNLSVFHYEGDIISFSLDDDFTLSKSTTLCFFSKFEMDTEWYFKYIELLRKFHTLSKLLNLMTKRGENVIFPVALRQTISPLFCGMKHFELITEVSPPSVAIKDIVDGLLWISPHAKTLAIKSVYSHIFCLEFEFSYKKGPVYEGEICECCKSVPISCWRQCIEKVEIKYTSYKQIKGYVFEGEEIWEMMDCLTGLTTSR